MVTEIKNAWVIPNEKDMYFGSLFIEDSKIIGKQWDGIVHQVIDAHENYCLPGLIDVHFHGSHGYDFIENPKEAIEVISKELIKEGTTSFMASLTVISHEDMLNLLDEYAQVKIDEYASHFLGIHSEGPYLSKDYKAVMDERYLRKPSISEFDEMMEHSHQLVKIMTLAPELEGMDTFISYASQYISCMIGHSNATSSQALKGLEQGAIGFTHLYNAMSQHVHRNPGVVTAGLISDAFCELIVDGFHVHPDVVKATYKAIGSKQIVLITDASLCKGQPDGDYIFSNAKCRKIGNTVRIIETGRIAGSAISMLDALKNMKTFCNCSLNECVQMACINPSLVAGISNQKGKLEAGYDADIILLDSSLNLTKTIISGKVIED